MVQWRLQLYAREAATRMQVDLTAFNTDGFDLAGCRNVWIHDAVIWTQAVANTVLRPTCYLIPCVIHLNAGPLDRSLLLLADLIHTYFIWKEDDIIEIK